MSSQVILDALEGGSFSKKNDIDAFELLEDMTSNNTLGPSERLQPAKREVGVHDLDVFTNLAAQVSLFTKKLQSQQMTINTIHTYSSRACKPRNDPYQKSKCQGGNFFE